MQAWLLSRSATAVGNVWGTFFPRNYNVSWRIPQSCVLRQRMATPDRQLWSTVAIHVNGLARLHQDLGVGHVFEHLRSKPPAYPCAVAFTFSLAEHQELLAVRQTG